MWVAKVRQERTEKLTSSDLHVRLNELDIRFSLFLNTKDKTMIDEKRNKKVDRLPKGQWSVIPIALLCMAVNWSEGKQGSGPEEDEVL